MNLHELPQDKKPSLQSTDRAASEAAPLVGSFGKREYLSFSELNRACEQEQLERLRERLYLEHPDFDTEIQEAKTALELADIAARLESSLEPLIRVLAAVSGRIPRVEEVMVQEGKGLHLSWKSKGFGFGPLNLYVNDKGKLCAANEGMTRQMLRGIFLRLADEIALERN